MTFWLYHPKGLFKSSTILPYKGEDFGDFLNFLTVFILSFYVYMRKYSVGNGELLKKIVLISVFLVLLLSFFCGKSNSNEKIKKHDYENYNDYDFTLSVD